MWVWLLWWFLSEPRIATQDRNMHRARGSSSRSVNLATMTWVLGATGWMLRTIFEPVFEVDFCIVNGSLASWHRAVLSGHVWRRRVQGFDTESTWVTWVTKKSSVALPAARLTTHIPSWIPLRTARPLGATFRTASSTDSEFDMTRWQRDCFATAQGQNAWVPQCGKNLRTFAAYFGAILHRFFLVGFVCLSLHLISHMVFCLHLSLSISLGYERWFTVEIRQTSETVIRLNGILMSY